MAHTTSASATAAWGASTARTSTPSAALIFAANSSRRSGVRAVHEGALDGADGAHRGELRLGLAPAADDADDAGVLAGHMAGGDAARGAGADGAERVGGDHREGASVLGGEEEHDHLAAAARAGDVRLQAGGAEVVGHPGHHLVGAAHERQAVAGDVRHRAARPLRERGVERVDALVHRQEPAYLVFGDEQHRASVRVGVGDSIACAPAP